MTTNSTASWVCPSGDLSAFGRAGCKGITIGLFKLVVVLVVGACCTTFPDEPEVPFDQFEVCYCDDAAAANSPNSQEPRLPDGT
jgi:hypothetical protein